MYSKEIMVVAVLFGMGNPSVFGQHRTVVPSGAARRHAVAAPYGPVGQTAPQRLVAQVNYDSVVSHGDCHSSGCRSRGCASTRGHSEIHSATFFGPTCQAYSCQTRYFGRPEPFGTALQSNMDLQIANGQRARLVLYDYDFENAADRDRAMLNAAGRRKLDRLVPVLESTGFPLIIEPSGSGEGLSESRRNHVVNLLENEMHFPIASEQVVVRDPPSAGLRGVEAYEMDRNQLSRTRSQGSGSSSDSSSRSGTSGFGTSGFGSSNSGSSSR